MTLTPLSIRLRTAFPPREVLPAHFSEEGNNLKSYKRNRELTEAIGHTWVDLTNFFLAHHDSALIHAGPQLFVHLLPAYLNYIMTVDAYQQEALPFLVLGELSLSDPTSPLERNIFQQRQAAFDPEQREVIRDILLSLQHERFREDARNAARHWP